MSATEGQPKPRGTHTPGVSIDAALHGRRPPCTPAPSPWGTGGGGGGGGKGFPTLHPLLASTGDLFPRPPLQ